MKQSVSKIGWVSNYRGNHHFVNHSEVIQPIHLDYRIIQFTIAECFVLCEICFLRKGHLHRNRTGGANTSSLVQLIATRTPFQDNISKYRCPNPHIIVCHIFKFTLPNIDFFLFSQTN